MELLELEQDVYTISSCFRNVEDDYIWVFTGVYGPILSRAKEKFWEELGAIKGLWDEPWSVGGDFNSIRFPGEMRYGHNLTAEMRRFSKVIKELNLKDLPSSGGQFTWFGGLHSQAASRLDRFLITNEWEDHFSGVFQSAIPRIASNHCPSLFEGGEVKKGKTPFRFENMWLLLDGFKELVCTWWTGYSIARSISHYLAEKLKALKGDLRRWNKEVFGNVSAKKSDALSRIQFGIQRRVLIHYPLRK